MSSLGDQDDAGLAEINEGDVHVAAGGMKQEGQEADGPASDSAHKALDIAEIKDNVAKCLVEEERVADGGVSAHADEGVKISTANESTSGVSELVQPKIAGPESIENRTSWDVNSSTECSSSAERVIENKPVERGDFLTVEASEARAEESLKEIPQAEEEHGFIKQFLSSVVEMVLGKVSLISSKSEEGDVIQCESQGCTRVRTDETVAVQNALPSTDEKDSLNPADLESAEGTRNESASSSIHEGGKTEKQPEKSKRFSRTPHVIIERVDQQFSKDTVDSEEQASSEEKKPFIVPIKKREDQALCSTKDPPQIQEEIETVHLKKEGAGQAGLDASPRQDGDDDAASVSPSSLKKRNDLDEWVRYLDATVPSHRMRSLCKKGEADELKAMLAEFRKESNDCDTLTLSELDLNALSEEGWTCLHEIITHECQFTEVARVLLEFGASTNTQDLHGDTPLHSALLYHNVANVRLVLEHGADATILNGVGRAAVHVADESECLRILLQHQGELVNAADAAGNTTLHYAAAAKDGGDRLAVIADLTANVVKPNAKNKMGSTPLHVAVSDVSAAAALLRLGADPNEQDVNGNTPLHLAVKGRHKETVRLLLENGADPKKLNLAGKSPIKAARDKEMRSLLLQLGKDSCHSPSPPVSSSANGAKRKVKSALDSPVEAVIRELPECSSPGILKRRAATDADPTAPPAKRPATGPRLRFSEVNDYSGVERLPEEPKRVRVQPIYAEPTFSSDED